MAYLPRHGRRHAALGGVSDIASAIGKVAEDPCLGKVTELVLKLNALEQKKPAAPPAAPGAPKPPAAPPIKGIGLCSAVKPLQVVVRIKQRPYLVPLAISAVVVGLFGLGYILGKGRR